jgi:uncharacterized caspase-like protein
LVANQELVLNNGLNKIDVSVLNDKGIESLTESYQIQYNLNDAKKPNLYVFAIGVSEFENAAMNLTYAAKDAQDLTNVFKNQNNEFENVNIKLITNKDATRENILNIKESLKNTKPNDQVIVFIASHGLLDAQLDYYLATHNINFENPSVNGLKYDELEALLDNIPARKKLMLIDACHSGEVDKENPVQALSTASVLDANIKTRGFKVGNSSSNQSLDASFELMKELFSDLRRNNGSIVISAAAGKEFALESDQWNNGVFTYAIINGLKSNKADLDKDGMITAKELSKYISIEVKTLTNGKQNPTSRTENIQFDYKIW